MSPSSHATVMLVIQPRPGDRRYVPILMTAPIRSSSSSINSTLERQRRVHARVDLSILHASGASPLTRCVGDQHLPPVADRPVTRPARSHSARSITATTVSGSLNACRCTSCFAGARDWVKAYASSWHDPGLPEDYATHAAACQRRGYGAYKIHSYYYWDPATKQFALGRPSHVEWDIETCRAVRAAVGDEMALTYDPRGHLSHLHRCASRRSRCSAWTWRTSATCRPGRTGSGRT